MAIVRYTLETRPKRSEEDWARFDALKDEDIDFSDIPEMNEFSGLVPRLPRALYKPVKVNVNCKLDADIVAWLKSGGKGYQTRLNAILRRVMINAAQKERQAAPAAR